MENRSGMMLGQCEDIPVIIDTIKDYIYTPESNDTSDKYLLLSNSTDNHLQLLNISTPEPPQYQLNDLCRLCSNSNSQMIPIFDEAATQNNLCEKIHKHLPIKITQVDTLPLQVCYQCAATLLAWHELVEGCQAAELKLLQMQAEIQKKNHKEKDITVPPIVVDPLKITQKNTNTADAQVQTIVEKSKETSEKDEEAANDLNSVRSELADFSKAYTSFSSCDASPSEPELDKKIFIYPTIGPTNEITVKTCETSAEMSSSELKSEFDSPSDSETSVCEPKRQRNQHLGDKSPFMCSLCGKCFRVLKIYKDHMRIHSGEKLYTCHVCGKQFGQTGSLYYHLRHVHGGVKNHTCDLCGRSFAMKTAMEDHRRIHTGERPYVCDACGKTFKSKASLYIHSKTHTDEFPFKCTHCNKAFRWNQQLLGHLTIHTGEKNHVCDVCGKSFGVKYDLTRHKRIHSQDKPYVCELCGASFGQKRYLRNHERSKHK